MGEGRDKEGDGDGDREKEITRVTETCTVRHEVTELTETCTREITRREVTEYTEMTRVEERLHSKEVLKRILGYLAGV